jgi:membrane protein implicated in regulation of membrane protease activity
VNWESFYLGTFQVGFLLSLVSFVAGAWHGGHFHGHGHGHLCGRGGAGRGLARFNFAAVTAFLAWFGGAGYLLERYSDIWTYLGLVIASASGFGGASIVLWFLGKLTASERPMDPADYEMVGVLGHVTSPIRAHGVGEILYVRDGARKATPARSEDSREVPRGAEVIVTRYERGIAYVRRWEEVLEKEPEHAHFN